MLMDLDVLASTYGMVGNVTGVLHLGAHLAEEAADYQRVFGPDVPVWWVEANPDVIPTIERIISVYPNQQVIRALVWERIGVWMEFHRTNYDGMSSSIYEFGTHPTFSPDTVMVDTIRQPTITVDDLVVICGVKANMLVMDLQGAEGPALRGAEWHLPHVRWVMSEVNCEEVYVGATQIGELDALLSDFERVETYWVGDQGWGDALWVRR
jgi:FkbM family methyltransferase